MGPGLSCHLVPTVSLPLMGQCIWGNEFEKEVYPLLAGGPQEAGSPARGLSHLPAAWGGGLCARLTVGWGWEQLGRSCWCQVTSGEGGAEGRALCWAKIRRDLGSSARRPKGLVAPDYCLRARSLRTPTPI